MKEYVKEAFLVLDFGTSKVRAIIIASDNGDSLLKREKEYVSNDRPGELDARQLFECSEGVVNDVVDECEKKGIKIAALSFSWFGANLVALGKDGEPLYPLIVSFDNRAEKQAEKIRSIVAPEIADKVLRGGLNGECIPAKILWLKENEKNIYEKTDLFGSMEQYVLGKLGFAGIWDKTIAATSQYYDVETDKWIASLVNAAGINGYPGDVCETTEVLGEIQNYGCVVMPYNIPVIPGGHDCVIAKLGQGVQPYGNDVCADMAGTFDLMGFYRRGYCDTKLADCITAPFDENFSLMAGGPLGEALNRFTDRLFSGEKKPPLNELFERAVFDGTREIRINETDPNRVALAELPGDNKEELFAAFVETITAQQAENFRNLEKLNGRPFKVMRIGGGGSRSDNWIQLKADMFNVIVEKSANPESSAVGATMLAGIAIGKYKDTKEAAGVLCQPGKVFYPDPDRVKRYKARH